ncbi:MAG TPA: glycerol-3-phosphate 1-O-acyltransferase PlsY [Bacillota bacterium]|jgi:glycerol-3-phosphate acyltransferase PlsY|nr:glycerol-3-phosphate 1-O-acyltransferase PlsY [Bacillota bacterium]HQJ38160.1 glycerol-3-phosphate 1-O-acyltransferase PlsY [Bacillota bacterium]
MKYVLVSIIAYLMGNIATAYLVSRAFGKIDIREHGSGNSGSTNVFRVLGAKPAVIVFLGDVLKGTAAVLIGRYLGGSYGEILAGIFVVAGHNWPILLGGKGGKGIATTIGLMLPIDPLMVVMILIVGIIVIITTRYVSLASIVGVTIYPIAMIITQKPLEYIIFSLVLSSVAIFKHRSNIERLLKGTESKFGQKKITEQEGK